MGAVPVKVAVGVDPAARLVTVPIESTGVTPFVPFVPFVPLVPSAPFCASMAHQEPLVSGEWPVLLASREM